jgi:4-hydroxy-3-methylbut-2-enyl diphosphate reductase
MKIYVAKHGGFCFGVKRAIRMASEASRDGHEVYSLGQLIHNPQVVEDLFKKGIITVDNLRRVKNKKVIIRSHGIHPAVLTMLRREKYDIIDATCPRVRRAQQFVEKLVREGYKVVIVGEKDHPEVQGLLGYAGGKAVIYSEKTTVRNKRVGIVPQTTIEISRLQHAVTRLIPEVLEMKIYNTICYETIHRLKEALNIVKKVDVMIVVGGKNSGNTTRLYEMCRAMKPSYHIESESEIKPRWFRKVRRVGITAGASTPREQVWQIAKYLRQLKTTLGRGRRAF